MNEASPIGHSTNLVGLSTSYLADVAFNEAPRELHISGVREMNGPLFEMLDLAADLGEAGEAFATYLMAMFAIDVEQREAGGAGRRRYRSSWLRLIKGWGYDSNGPEGAVLKGWVESRFGLFPTWHKAALTRFSSGVWTTYVEEKMSSRFHNNSIFTQLDLLYEFCQWALARFVAPGLTHLTLYRGINGFDEHPVTRRIDRRTVVMRLNSLSSFSADREVADCFGDIVLTARVPVQKILFFNTLMASHPLKGEGEYLVVGGDYVVTTAY
ncbi:NAD(+)--dinitrogen-reductase ADP-D-ribosyltransferase [Siculibacillus lacustris]|uniref:NAD(+)--dinitrogen-reductase ADP-D-ribosyltransferase n=1 Tax=Siculibacillus lacustris TaxID=1549641 RepID=A0A4V2KTF0_9HYPH|nr:NAD(+)--dinitrogen-reductase ADP-D-ribosyltransferase [Siculibacillus lacustris]TBW36998.1 NAD(+)--dinitrogen-reductase ADP-D-ribosyltransferase [Siculibacillus lacustris]